MDEKTLTAVATPLAMFQIQVNALLLLLERQHPDAHLREDFQSLVSEGVQAVGIQTLESIKGQIRNSIG